VFTSYADALEACDGGYDSDLVAAVVAAKTARLSDVIHLQSAARTFTALALAPDAKAVLDFGGAAGYHHRIAETVRPGIEWHVVETPAMTRHAGPRQGLHFHDAIPEMTPDLVFTSGALQYVPDPLATLNDLLALDPAHVFVTRLEVGQRRVEVQESRLSENGPGPLPAGFTDRTIRYPVTVLPWNDYETVLTGRGYTVLHRFDEDGMVGAYAIP
jgi:putative methyltransferase (TIGR04325 family)